MQDAKLDTATNEPKSQPDSQLPDTENPQNLIPADETHDLAVQHPQSNEDVEITDDVKVENLIASLANYSTSGVGFKQSPFLIVYWQGTPGTPYAALPDDSTGQKEAILVVFKLYAKLAYLVHGSKIEMRIMYRWIPESLWTANFSAKETRTILMAEENRIAAALKSRVSMCDLQWRDLPGYPKLPVTLSQLFQVATARAKHARAAYFRSLIDQHNEQAYKWTHFVLGDVDGRIPVKEILRTSDPGCATRNHLISTMVEWAGIHYNGMLKNIVRR